MGGPEGAAAFDGSWVDEDGATIRVEGGCMQGPGGEPVPLVMTGSGACSFHLGGQVFEGRLQQNGRQLAWSDGVAWTRLAEEPGRVDSTSTGTEALTFEEATKLGGTLRVHPDKEVVLGACKEAGLDPAAGAPLWRAAVGLLVTVLAHDPIDRTIECRVPSVGDVWLPFAALLRAREGEPAELRPLAGERPRDVRKSEDPPSRSEPRTAWEWEQPAEPPADESAVSPEPTQLEDPQESAGQRWFAQRSERLWQELRELEAKGFAEQKRRLRALQLELHPDKQPVELRSQAQQLFLLVQCEWETVQKTAAEEKKQQDERQRREDEERRVREAAAKHHRQGQEQQQWEDQQARDRRRREEEHRRRLLTQRRQPAARREPREPDEDSEPEEPDDPREDVSKWNEARFKEAAAAFKLAEESRLKKEDDVRKKSRRMNIAGVPGDPRTSPVEVRIMDPTSEEFVTGRPLYTFKSAKRSWLVCDIKEEISRVGRISRLSQRLSVTSATETHSTTENELEDGDSLSSLPPGPVISLTLFVAPHMYDDYEYLLKGVQRSYRMLQWAPLSLRSDRLIIRTAMRQSWLALKHASRELRGDRAMVLKAIKQDGAALEFAAGRLPADRALVLPAIRRNWRALQYASTEMRADPELVLRAARQDLEALHWAAPELLDNRDFALTLADDNPSAVHYVSSRMKADRELMLRVVQQDPWALQYADPKLKADRELVLKAVRQDPGVLEHAAPAVRSDQKILAACKGHWEALKHVDEEHKGAAEADLWKASYSPHFDMAAYQAKLFGGQPPPNFFKR